MTRLTSILLITGACLALATDGVAHLPEGVVYRAFPFPDDAVPAMDGNLADWAGVPAEYFFDLTHHEEISAKLSDQYDRSDLDVRRAAVGWNDRLNRLYFMAEVFDDVVRFSKPSTDSLDTYHSRLHGAHVHGADIWEIVIDADHGGELVVGHSEDPSVEMRHRSAYAQNYHLYMPPLNGEYWHWLWGKAMWLPDPQWSGMGYTFAGADTDSGTVTYETYLTPFDDLHPAGIDSSVLHDLTAGNIIGLSWAFLDADDSDTNFDAFWSLSKEQGQMCCDGSYLVDFLLMPPVE
jgi:hypothetical protein